MTHIFKESYHPNRKLFWRLLWNENLDGDWEEENSNPPSTQKKKYEVDFWHPQYVEIYHCLLLILYVSYICLNIDFFLKKSSRLGYTAYEYFSRQTDILESAKIKRFFFFTKTLVNFRIKNVCYTVLSQLILFLVRKQEERKAFKGFQ